MATEHNGQNGRNWTPVLSILALITGVSAVITPMYAGLLNEKESRKELEIRVKANEDGRTTILAKLAAIEVQFAEIETQFRGAKDELKGVQGLVDNKLLAVDDKLQKEIAAQATAAEIVRQNQKENVAAVQELKVRWAALETFVKFGNKP